MPRDADSLAALLADARVWRLKDATAAASRPAWPTGQAALDARLPDGGWPTAALVEVLLAGPGLGEVQLFLPALLAGGGARDAGGGRWLIWIAPPYEPYAPALAQQGLDLRRFLVVRPESGVEALWAAEQALQSGACAAVFLWLKGSDPRWLRRLKLAAEEGGALGVLFRPERHRFESSPANLRLAVSRDAAGLRLELLKARGGQPASLALEL